MAVLVYLGVGISSFPTRLPDELVHYFGASRSEALRKKVESLLAEATPDTWTREIGVAIDQVRQTMQATHPELSDDAVRALVWDFSHSNK